MAGARRENACFDASLRTIEARDNERRLHQREFETINYEGFYQVSLPSNVGVTSPAANSRVDSRLSRGSSLV
jgi:hypothetical protein